MSNGKKGYRGGKNAKQVDGECWGKSWLAILYTGLRGKAAPGGDI